jgi:hypothetical protein
VGNRPSFCAARQAQVALRPRAGEQEAHVPHPLDDARQRVEREEAGFSYTSRPTSSTSRSSGDA